jgi:hypothetical protein
MTYSSSSAPRLGTPRNPERATLGPEVEAVSRTITSTAAGVGRPFLDWQRRAAAITQELDPATGRRWYRTVVVIVPRQQGKTTWVEAQLAHGALRRPDSTSLYMAQSQKYAGDRIIHELVAKRLDRSPVMRGRYRPVKSNGSQGIRWANGSYTATAANNDTAGHGLTIDADAVVDEAFAHVDLTSVQALSPTQVTCSEPQLWIVSTLGDGTDGLVQHFQDIGAAALNDPQSQVCYLEYSAPPGPAVDDLELWHQTMPALGVTCTVAELRNQLVTLGEPEFDRAFLCRRRPEAHASKIPAEVWAAQLRTVAGAAPVGPAVLAVDVAHDRSSSTIAAAAATATGELVVIVDTRPGTSWIVGALRDLQRARRPAAIVADRRAPVGSMVDRLTLELGALLEPSTLDFSQSAGLLLDELTEGTTVHVGQAQLDIAAAQARTRPLGDLWAWNRRESPCDISPLCAATLAVWGHRRTFPTSRRGVIY